MFSNSLMISTYLCCPFIVLILFNSNRCSVVTGLFCLIAIKFFGTIIFGCVWVTGGIAVPFRGPPRYNPRRRSAAWGGWWSAGDRSSLASSTRIPAELDAMLRRAPHPTRLAPSPCSLERPFSSASSSISDASHPSHEDDASILTGKITSKIHKSKIQRFVDETMGTTNMILHEDNEKKIAAIVQKSVKFYFMQSALLT